jgi:hypothetical protein
LSERDTFDAAGITVAEIILRATEKPKEMPKKTIQYQVDLQAPMHKEYSSIILKKYLLFTGKA